MCWEWEGGKETGREADVWLIITILERKLVGLDAVGSGYQGWIHRAEVAQSADLFLSPWIR